MSKRKIKESKEKIYSLAQMATNRIYENKFLHEQVSLYEDQIKLIKDFLIKCSKLDNDKNYKTNFIFEEINNITNLLKISNKKLKEEKNKRAQKLELYEDEIFNEDTTIRQKLKISEIDNFILQFKIKENNSHILKLNNVLKDLEVNRLFPPEKKEIKVKNEISTSYLDDNLENSSKKLNRELLFYNLYNTSCIKFNTKKNNLQKKSEFLEELIEILKKALKKDISKIYKEDEDYNIQLKELINSNNQTTRNKSKTKIEILTVSQLFNVDNDEGKAEEIIDDELHSDDEIIFEPKVKQPIKVGKDENLKKIKSQVPGVDLSQIEFNKQKVMNEADLYSLENRLFQAQDIDEKINEMRFKNKEILHRLKTNIKKFNAMQNFVTGTKKNYKLLKNIKLKTSVSIFNMSTPGKDLNEIEEIKEEPIEEEKEDNLAQVNLDQDNLDNSDQDNLDQDNSLIRESINFAQSSFSERKKPKMNIKKSIKKKGKRKKLNNKIRKKIKRAKSK